MIINDVRAGFAVDLVSPAALPVFCCHWPNVFWAPDTPTAQVPVQFCCVRFRRLLIIITALFWSELFLLREVGSLLWGQIPAAAVVEQWIASRSASLISSWWFRLDSYLWQQLLPALPLVSQMVVSPPDTFSSACVPFEVSSLSFPSVRLWSPPRSRFFICHICHVVSILHATLNKQTICPITPSLQALFFTSSLSTICHLLPNLSQPLSHLIIPSRLRSASVPVPPNSPPAHRLPLNCHTWKDSFSLLCLFWLCAALSRGWICYWKSECALWRILNLEPSQTESVYLRVTTFPGAAGRIGSPHLVPCSRLIMFTTAALWWESSN